MTRSPMPGQATFFLLALGVAVLVSLYLFSPCVPEPTQCPAAFGTHWDTFYLKSGAKLALAPAPLVSEGKTMARAQAPGDVALRRRSIS